MSRRPGDLVVSEPDKMGLGLKHNTMGVLNQGSDLDHHLEHISGNTTLVGLDEVGMLRGHFCGADPQALASSGIDQSAGTVASGVGEHRTRVLAARLVVAAPLDDLRHLSLAFAFITWGERQPTTNDELIHAER